MVPTSENTLQANFAECPFCGVRCMSLVSASKEPMEKESVLFVLHV
jgi:hypothetical protein